MKITLDNNNFNHVRDFLVYLQTNYEHDKLFSGEVTLLLELEEFSQENFNELAQFFLNPERPLLYRFEFSPQQSEYQLTFDNLYLICKRQKFSHEFQKQIIDLTGPSIISTHPPSIRKTKKNWVEGTYAPRIALQLQYPTPYTIKTEHQKQRAIPRKRKNEEEPHNQYSIENTPLTDNLKLSPLDVRPITGSYHQIKMAWKDEEQRRRFKTEFHDLLDSGTLPEQRQSVFISLLSHFTGYDSSKLKWIRLLQTLPLSDQNYQGLAQVLLHTGADGVLLLLQQFKALHDKELFKDFNDLFLDKPENYLTIVSTEGLNSLKKLTALSNEQHTWWAHLVSLHKAAGIPTQFDDLFLAYSYFLDQLDQKNLTLPLACRVKNKGHMKHSLACILYLIHNSSDPEEQLTYLDDIDLDAACLASRNHYQLITREMNLLRLEEDIPDFSVPRNPHDVYAWLVQIDLPYDECLTRFYRFVGVQEWAFQHEVYQRIEQEISKNDKFNHKNKALLLNIALFLTTGKHACSQLEDPCLQFKTLISQLIASNDLNVDLNHYLFPILNTFARSLAHLSWESMPSADEFVRIIESLLRTRENKGIDSEQMSDEFQKKIELVLDVIAIYGPAAYAILDNYENRFAVEKTKALPIQKFALSHLLNHLIPPSKLNHFLSERFHDQPEPLSQFVTLLSLVNDKIPEVTQDEVDNEFEAKIKILAQELQNIPAERRKQVLSIFTNIKIEDSYRLPTLDQLISTVNKVAQADLILNSMPSVPHQTAAILHIIQTELPDLKIGHEPQKETEINLFNLLLQNYEEWQLDDKFAAFPEKLKSYIEPWMQAHLVVLYYLRRKPVVPSAVFDALVEEEQEVKKLLNSRWFAWTLSGYPQEKIQMTQLLGSEFFSKQSFLTVLKARLKALCQSKLNTALKSLHVNDVDFVDYLLGSIKGFETDLSNDKVLMDLEQQIGHVNHLISTLILIKNENNIEYHQCVPLLSDITKVLKSRNIDFSPLHINNLLLSLSQRTPISVVSPLKIISHLLNTIPEYSQKQLEDTLNEVAYLTTFEEELGQEAYVNLLHCSVAHNLSQKSVLPLNQLIGMKSFPEIDKKESQELFTALIDVIKAAGPEIDGQELKKVIDKTSMMIQTKTTLLTRVPLLTLLLRTCVKGSHDELVRYNHILDTLKDLNDSELNKWAKILLKLAEGTSENNIHLLLDVEAGLELNPMHLDELTHLFDFPPYPHLKSFIKILNGYVKDIPVYANGFDKDPKSGRAPQTNSFGIILKDSSQIIEEQFESSKMKQSIAQIKNIFEDTPLNSQEQYDLAQQLTYVNAIGKEQPFSLCVGTDSATSPIKIYKNLTQVSRAELRELSNTLIAALRKQNSDNHEKLKNQLKLLAVLREQYFRATGKFPEPTQILAILISLKNQKNLLMEIDDEEGNHISAALFAVMQWVQADGGTVDVCAPSQHIQDETFLNQDQYFFTSLGITSSSIKAGSPKGTYQVGGINYSTPGDLALYRSRAKKENEDLTAYKEGRVLSSNLILYGADFSEFDERVLFNLTSGTEDEENDNPYAWVYPLVNQFIQQKKFRSLYETDAWSEEKDITELKEFLYLQAETGWQKKQLNLLPETKYHLWLNSAITAQTYIEGEDFVIIPSKTPHHVAIPLSQKNPQTHTSFMEQQFLAARLGLEYSGLEFDIEPERTIVNSVSFKDLTDDYKKQGRIIYLSKDLCKKEKIAQHCALLDVNGGFQLQVHSKNTALHRKNITNPEASLNAIKKYIICAESNQPVIIITKNPQELRKIEKKLKAVFPEKDISVCDKVGLDTEKWVKNHSGKYNKITLVSSDVVARLQFKTKCPEGFLSIQTDLENSETTEQIIHCISGKNRPGKHVVFYDQQGSFTTKFWNYETEGDRKKMIAETAELKKLQDEDLAVAHDYLQRVSSIQQVVLEQFQEWKEFLHLVYPKSEWSLLDGELLRKRNEFILSLNEQWDNCRHLTSSGYPHAFACRDANKQIQTGALDEALAIYEISVNSLWEIQREFLKNKAKNVIVADSINDLRCRYLDGVSLREQIQLHRLTHRDSKKVRLAEKKKARRYLESGMEVSGAMLRFGDGDVETNRTAFATSQVKLFAADMTHIIKNNRYLKKSIREILAEQAMNAPNLEVLVGLLVDYGNRYLPEACFSEKYAMQPIIQELLKVYQEVGLEETTDIKDLKKFYFDNVIEEIVDDLEHSLSWAMKENRGLGYLLERSAVTAAANEILHATHIVKKANIQERQLAIKNLYQILAKHESKLEGLWIFSFGHKNTRTLIKKTLTTLNQVTALGSESDLDVDFIQRCKEESFSGLMVDRMHTTITTMEKEDRTLKNDDEWDVIKKTLNSTLSGNKTIYAFHEAYFYLSQKVAELSRTGSKLHKQVIQLRGEIRILCETFSQKHPEWENPNKYLIEKAENFKEKLKGFQGFEVSEVYFEEGHNGYRDYFDLVIQGSGSHPLLQDFTQYHSRKQELSKEREVIELRLIQAMEQLSKIEKVIKEKLPLLKLESKAAVNAEQFPEQFQEEIKKILTIKAWITADLPHDLSAFSDEIRQCFLDRELMKQFNFPNLKSEEIDQIQDIILKINFRDLHERMVDGTKPKSIFGNISSYFSSYLITPENMEDWRCEFDMLLERPNQKLQNNFGPNLNENWHLLATQLEQLREQISGQVESLKQQISFLDGAIKEEEKRECFYVKRINGMAELFEFESQLILINKHQEARKVAALSHKESEPKTLDEIIPPQIKNVLHNESISFAL